MTKFLRTLPAAVVAVIGLGYGVLALTSGVAPGLSREAVAADGQAIAGEALNPTVSSRDWQQVNGTTSTVVDTRTGKRGRNAWR